jgi:hypothetical protein
VIYQKLSEFLLCANYCIGLKNTKKSGGYIPPLVRKNNKLENKTLKFNIIKPVGTA